MIYDFALDIPANTLASAPLEEVVALTLGTIHRVEFEFPAGCAGLVYVRVLHRRHQIWPTNPDGAFRSDDHVIAFNEDFELEGPPPNLTLVGYNLDDSYSHMITFRFGVKAAPVRTGGWEETPVGQAVLGILAGA